MLSEIKKSWLNFLLILLLPEITIIISFVVILEYFSIKSNNVLIISLCTSVIAIFAGCCGARIDSELRKIKGNTLLITQGKNAVRNLKLSQSYLQEIYARLLEYKKQAKKESIKPEVLEIWLDETIQKIAMVQKQGINAIEGWSSWIPETDITTQVEKRDNLQKNISDLEAHILTLEHSSSESEKDRKQLKNDLSKAKEELQQRNLQLDRALYGINNLSSPTIENPLYQNLLATSPVTLSSVLGQIDNGQVQVGVTTPTINNFKLRI